MRIGPSGEDQIKLAPTDERSAKRLGVAAVWVAMFAWAWGYVLVKWSTLDGLVFAMFRLWAGAAISYVAMLLTGRRLSWDVFRACALGGVIFSARLSSVDLNAGGGTILLDAIEKITKVGMEGGVRVIRRQIEKQITDGLIDAKADGAKKVRLEAEGERVRVIPVLDDAAPGAGVAPTAAGGGTTRLMQPAPAPAQTKSKQSL